jgi:hypothetical protein
VNVDVDVDGDGDADADVDVDVEVDVDVNVGVDVDVDVAADTWLMNLSPQSPRGLEKGAARLSKSAARLFAIA